MDINNGFTIQFGLCPTKTSGVTVVFPIAYTQKAISVVTNILDVSGGEARRIISLTKTEFESTRSGSVNTAFYWISVGY